MYFIIIMGVLTLCFGWKIALGLAIVAQVAISIWALSASKE